MADDHRLDEALEGRRRRRDRRALERTVVGYLVADVVTPIDTIDIVLGEVDT